jgi:DNA-directed RNA polymerase specialized sigma subunit
MPEAEYKPASPDHEAFLKKALERKGFAGAYEGLEDEYKLVRELLAARVSAGLTREQIAASMGTSKSAVSRREGGGALAVGEHAQEVCQSRRL